MATDLDDDEVFEVENILKRRVRKERVEYLVRWKGFGKEEDSWEPEEHLNGCRGLIRDYLRSMKSSDISPRKTRRRTTNLPPLTNAKDDSYTRIKTPKKPQVKVLRMKLRPPPSPLASKTRSNRMSSSISDKIHIFEEEKMTVEEEKQSVKKRQTRKEFKVKKNTSKQPKNISSNGIQLFVFVAVVLIFVILVASLFKPVETR